MTKEELEKKLQNENQRFSIREDGHFNGTKNLQERIDAVRNQKSELGGCSWSGWGN